MKKKILIFSVAYEPFIGGAEVAVREITARIPEYEFEMITVNLDGKQKSEEQIGNIRVYRIGGKGKIHKLLFPFSAWFLAKRLHTQKKYDMTWSIMASFSGFAALFFKFSFPAIPFILTLQEGDPISYIKRQVWFVYPLFKRIFTKATIIQTISHYLAGFAKDMGATNPIIVIPNGVDLKLFSNIQPHTHMGTVLITTSRLVEKNAIGDIINALTFLPETVTLTIIGTGHLEATLKKHVIDNKLESRVYFLGQKQYSEIPQYLAASDIFIRPSLSEGMGNSFIEAMAAGVPVIATPVGGIPDFLKDKQTGVLCEVKNPKSIADAVTWLMDHPTERQKIIEQAKLMVIENYDWNMIANKMKTEIFDRV